MQEKYKGKKKSVSGFALGITSLLFIMSLCVSNILYAQSLTVKDQLIALNKEWKKADTKEAFFSSRKTFATEVDLIQTHLAQVETNLRNRDVSHLNIEQQTKRKAGLQLLHDYWTKGVFPKNTFHEKRTPYFIDIFGTYCAVGYLIKETGFDALAQRIHREHNYGYINDLKTQYPEIGNWAKEYGFSTDELAWIQPLYLNNFSACISPTFSTQITVTNTTCSNSCDGNIVVPSHHPQTMQPITYAFISPAGICGNLCAQTYTITASDANNNSIDYIVTVGVNNPPAVINAQSSCGNVCSGSISFDSIGANLIPNQYQLWGSNIFITQNTPVFDSLCQGSLYYLSFSVPNGCSWDYGPYTINQGPAFNSNANISSPIPCNGDSGLVQVSAVGGTPPYNGTGTFPVVAGTHIFQVSDANNCVSTTTFTVNQPAPLVINDSIITPILCHGDSALLQISGSGGTSPYTGTGNFTYLAGTYTISISDSNNCTTTANINISEPQPLSLNLTMFPDNGTNNGTAVCNPLGGNPPYTYSWNTGGTTDAIFNLSTGWYTCVLSDVNGCTQTDSIYVPMQFPQGLNQTQNITLRISPNPTKDYLTIDFTEKQHLVETHLRNLSGQTLSKQTAAQTAHIQLDLRAYPKGIYVLEIRSNKEIKYVKVVKE